MTTRTDIEVSDIYFGAMMGIAPIDESPNFAEIFGRGLENCVGGRLCRLFIGKGEEKNHVLTVIKPDKIRLMHRYEDLPRDVQEKVRILVKDYGYHVTSACNEEL